MKSQTTLTLLALALAAGCVKNDATIELYAVCHFPDDATACGTEGKCSSLLAGRPWAFTRTSGGLNSLDLFIQVNNNLENNADATAYRVNTNDFVIEEFRMKYSSVPALALPSYTDPTNQIVAAGGSSTPIVKLIPAAVMQAVIDQNPTYPDPAFSASVSGALVEIEVRAVGHTRDGQKIETAPWTVAADVRNGMFVDPVCAGTTATLVLCPHSGQTGTYACK